MFFTLLSLATAAVALPSTLVCTSTQSQPNPIAAQYQNLTTGTINGTIAVLPIPYAQARSIVPSQYAILKESYLQWLPEFAAADLYPAMLQTQLDHDVGEGTTIKIPDFRRSSISYPFVDRLGDGYTHMTFDPINLESAQIIALLGTSAYGIAAVPATFDPPCDAYAGEPSYSNAYDLTGKLAMGTLFARSEKSPYSIDFWKNITNQPQFAYNTLVCDNYIRLFNSSVTTNYPPTPVQGNVTAASPYFATSTTFSNVYGLRLDNAFIENNLVSCESLKGYHGTGSGD